MSHVQRSFVSVALLSLVALASACDDPKPAPAASPPATPAVVAPVAPDAKPVAVATPAPASPPADPADFALDVSHSRVGFAVRHMMVSNTRGYFPKFSGKVFIDEKTPAASRVEIDVETASIDSQDPKRDEHLRSPDFFDVKRFPKMTFKSTKVVRAGDGYEVTGDLTIRDQTKPVVLKVDALTAETKDPWGGTRRGTKASAKLNRKDFGLTWNKALEAGGGVVVGEEVTLELEVELVKAKPGEKKM